MELITRERDRLLHRTSRVYGLSFAVVSLLCLVIPGAVDTTALVLAAPFYVLLGVAFWRIGAATSSAWILTAAASGLIAVVLTTLLSATPPEANGITAVMQLAAGSLGALAAPLTVSPRRIVVLVGLFVLIAGTTLIATWDLQDPLRTAALLALGWGLPTVIGLWVCAAVPRAAKRIGSIGRAHRAERQASELEAQRRQGARLLHDTVLATLTLLAHSGVGVSPEALQQQAGDDARLLRQLRLGGTPVPPPTSPVSTEPVEETVLGTTLESVKQRFGRMGLEVSWHGTGQVLLPSDVLDAFLLSLAECLENVRRHSGVTQAHVTITDDETTVRALVTDSGVGFSLDGVEEHKLGFKESVVGRLREVGGNARLFSAPGQGTTVVLEVPR
ncbi:signal transduction histidine kinase [Diaminobutyricimonas aerilata]|uniref:Signal transduction histidine kinase n=1 Tax=Diaminobutyricimonas aerilata TaxID=1162967 RepID=A0A2M9CLJ5_9MICO|nr:ATP-binding protein [Diaminobutyricimonas aerilata]PJJ72774.1 signal transduction histidine kinase [Diaminobutyricimonas aerilata]